MTSLIALLELKGIITRAEGERLVEFINSKPQPTLLDDAVNQIKDFLSDVLQELEPVTKKAVTAAKTEAKKVASKVKDEVHNELEAAVSLAAEAAHDRKSE